MSEQLLGLMRVATWDATMVARKAVNWGDLLVGMTVDLRAVNWVYSMVECWVVLSAVLRVETKACLRVVSRVLRLVGRWAAQWVECSAVSKADWMAVWMVVMMALLAAVCWVVW